MANHLRTQRHDGGNTDGRHGDYEPDASAPSEMVATNGTTSSQPTLFHKVKNERSILALAVSDARLFAGTQSGEILVGVWERILEAGCELSKIV